MKYIDREDLRKMVKEVAGAVLVSDYSVQITYKTKENEKRDMFYIYETQEEVDLLNKNIQENKIIEAELEKSLKKKYEIAKAQNDYQTMAEIENKDTDLIAHEKHSIRRTLHINEKLTEHMQEIYSRFENEAKPLNEKDSEFFLLVEIKEEKDRTYINCPPKIEKIVNILLSSFNKEIVDKECAKWQNWLKEQEAQFKEYYGNCFIR